MTTDDFRCMALSLAGAEESSGLGYPNFRAGRKSFATIENAVAVVRLTRDQQASFMAAAPEMFTPASSGWGRLGSTVVRLEAGSKIISSPASTIAGVTSISSSGAPAPCESGFVECDINPPK